MKIKASRAEQLIAKYREEKESKSPKAPLVEVKSLAERQLAAQIAFWNKPINIK